MEDETVPRQIKRKIEQVIDLLKLHGMEYEEIVASKWGSQYNFIFPNSPYYQLYLLKLTQMNENKEKEADMQSSTVALDYEGNLEEISVGAMTQIVRQEIRQVHPPYSPFDSSIYQHHVNFDPQQKTLSFKISNLIDKYQHLTQTNPTKEEEKNVKKTFDKGDELRKELGTRHDGSLGVYAGKKYQGLGSHNQFSQFRKEQSQQYFSSIQQKQRQN